MKGIFKINSNRIYSMWRNIAYSYLVVIFVLLFSFLFPPFLAPIVSSAGALAIYLLAYNIKSRQTNCMMIPGSLFISLIVYTFAILVLNMLDLWVPSISIWYELSFYAPPFVPILAFSPIMFLTCLLFYIKRENNNICTDCQLLNGHWLHRGQIGRILHSQSRVELKNAVCVFGFLTFISWGYFLFLYNSVNLTARDSFVFVWVPILLLIFDIFYFANHYFKIYMDLQQLQLVASQKELDEMPMVTWVRYYVICEDSMYLNLHSKDDINDASDKPVVDTPFIVSRQTNGITELEARRIIQSLTGVADGELRFFFDRKLSDNQKNNVVRFFYFLPGETASYPELKNVPGNWISSNKFKTLHYTAPTLRLSAMLNIDMTRLITILITSKTFNEKGERRTKLKKYHPSFNFEELKNCKIDFQKNTWLHVSYFNSNTPNFRLKRFWRNLTRGNKIPVDD